MLNRFARQNAAERIHGYFNPIHPTQSKEKTFQAAKTEAAKAINETLANMESLTFEDYINEVRSARVRRPAGSDASWEALNDLLVQLEGAGMAIHGQYRGKFALDFTKSYAALGVEVEQAAQSSTDKSDLEIMRVLVCSSGHVAKAEAKKIDEDDDHFWNLAAPVLCPPMDWTKGWTFYIGGGEGPVANPGLSEGLIGAINTARASGIDWIHFDGDGPRLPGVPTYEW